MKNSRLVFVALLAVLAASCSRGARVSGVLKDAPEAEVEVRLLDINRYRTLDTLKTDARGAFTYAAEVEKGQPEFFYLFYHGRRVASLLLQAGDRVDLTGFLRFYNGALPRITAITQSEGMLTEAS